MYNQNYFCTFSKVDFAGEYSLRYWVQSLASAGAKLSSVGLANQVIQVLPKPLLTTAYPDLLEVTQYDGYFPVRLYGANLRTDFAKIWFGTKAQTTFKASKDGTYIDVDAPLADLAYDQDKLTVQVRVQVNEDSYQSNSVTVTYFHFKVKSIYMSCEQDTSSAIGSLSCSKGNEIKFYDNGLFIRYASPLVVETVSGTIR